VSVSEDVFIDVSEDASVDVSTDISMDVTGGISVGESAGILPQLVKQENKRVLVTHSTVSFLKLVMLKPPCCSAMKVRQSVDNS
jgi:hypothetical protein